MQYRVFSLTMPNNNYWNRKWTGDGRGFYIVKRYADKSPVLELVDKSNGHYYDFGDGWGAHVEIERVTREGAAKYKKKSEGFQGYDWMVAQIEQYGRILTRSEQR